MAGDFKVSVNISKLQADTTEMSRGLDAVVASLSGTGHGQVLTSARKKLPGERGRALHGRGVANILADRGRDAFLYDVGTADLVEGFIAEEVADALTDAFSQASPQKSRIKTVLRAGAMELADSAKANISRGGLGDKKVLRSKRSAWANYWVSLAKRGLASLKFGNPPPYGFKTGRFWAGIRGFWTIGRGL